MTLPTTESPEGQDKYLAELRSRSTKRVPGMQRTKPALAEDTYADDVRRGRDPIAKFERVLLKAWVRDGHAGLVTPGGHTLVGGENAPISMLPDEYEAFVKYSVETPEEAQNYALAEEAFEHMIAKDVIAMLVNGYVDSTGKTIDGDAAYSESRPKEVADLLKNGTASSVMQAAARIALEVTAYSVPMIYYERFSEPSKPVLRVVVLDPAVPAPIYTRQAMRAQESEKQNDAARVITEGIVTALAPVLQRMADVLAAIAPAPKGGK